MKKIEYDFQRYVSAIETPVMLIGPKGKRIVNACWDTGATHTTVSKRIAEELGFEDYGEIYGFSVGSQMTYRKYKAIVDIGSKIRFNGIILGTEHISASDIGLLIGMDLISLGNFKLENLKGRTVFSFETE